jgi:hypothetical protein
VLLSRPELGIETPGFGALRRVENREVVRAADCRRAGAVWLIGVIAMSDRSTIPADTDAGRPRDVDDAGAGDPWLVLAAALGRAAVRAERAKATSTTDKEHYTTSRRTPRGKRP